MEASHPVLPEAWRPALHAAAQEHLRTQSQGSHATITAAPAGWNSDEKGISERSSKGGVFIEPLRANANPSAERNGAVGEEARCPNPRDLYSSVAPSAEFGLVRQNA